MRGALNIALAALCWLAAFDAGCKAPAARVSSYGVRVVARTDADDPLAGVRVALAGRELGATDAQGTLETAVTGREGQLIALEAHCPEHYSGPAEQPSLLLKSFESIDPAATRSTTLEVTCSADERLALVAIRTGQAGIPVLLRGVVVAHTSAGGTAHVSVRQAAGSSFQLTLDTKEQPDLRPASPTRLFAVAPRDDFAVWDQRFERQEKPVVKRKRVVKPAAAAPPAKPAPYRLD